jgi:hypothetical protein
MINVDEVINQENKRKQKIIDTVSQKGLCIGCQKMESFGMKNKGGHIPAHHKNPEGHTGNDHSHHIYGTKIFRRQKKGIRPEIPQKATTYCGKKKNPEN